MNGRAVRAPSQDNLPLVVIEDLPRASPEGLKGVDVQRKEGIHIGSD